MASGYISSPEDGQLTWLFESASKYEFSKNIYLKWVEWFELLSKERIFKLRRIVWLSFIKSKVIRLKFKPLSIPVEALLLFLRLKYIIEVMSTDNFVNW